LEVEIIMEEGVKEGFEGDTRAIVRREESGQ